MQITIIAKQQSFVLSDSKMVFKCQTDTVCWTEWLTNTNIRWLMGKHTVHAM